jgi:hypothetical protein
MCDKFSVQRSACMKRRQCADEWVRDRSTSGGQRQRADERMRDLRSLDDDVSAQTIMRDNGWYVRMRDKSRKVES